MNIIKNNINNLDIKKDVVSDKLGKNEKVIVSEPKNDKKIIASTENKKLISEVKDNSKPEIKSKPILSKNSSNQSSNVCNVVNQISDKNKQSDIKDFLKDARAKGKQK